MEIPLNAQVECSDGIFGRSKFVLINPVSDTISHLIVKKDDVPFTEYIVPLEMIHETVAGTIRLRSTKAELERMDPFIKEAVVKDQMPERSIPFGGAIYGMQSYYYLPYVTYDRTVYDTVEYRDIPLGELAVRSGARVEATDGPIGHVDEFVVNSENSRISHLVMREGHLWGQKDVIIPISAMDKVRDDVVILNIDKHQVEALPTFPLLRRWAASLV
jgi:sporulation protein YlmC with PRC-barrel domain